MSENNNISSLFDVSGNLTLITMERYLRNELSSQEKLVVEDHLVKSGFDREALEGVEKHLVGEFSKDIQNLNNEIHLVARRKAGKSDLLKSGRIYWYAAASVVFIVVLSFLMIYLFRSPLEKPQLAKVQPDKVADSPIPTMQTKKDFKIEETKDVAKTVHHLKIVEDTDSESMPPETDQESNELDKNLKIEDDIAPLMDQVQSENSVREELKVVSQEMQSEKQVFAIVEQMPEFPGGDTALYSFLAKNIQYPDSAESAGIQGMVYVSFIVNKDGSITDARVLRGIGGGCDDEALRVINLMPKWKPGRQRGIPVACQFNLPVRFKLGK